MTRRKALRLRRYDQIVYLPPETGGDPAHLAARYGVVWDISAPLARVAVYFFQDDPDLALERMPIYVPWRFLQRFDFLEPAIIRGLFCAGD